MTKVNGLIDTLKYIPIYANMTLHMWARVWGKDKERTYGFIFLHVGYFYVFTRMFSTVYKGLEANK